MTAETDERAWVKVAVDLPNNPKLVDAAPQAKWLYVTGFCIAGRDLTNGVIRPTVAVAEADVPAKYGNDLVRRGVWHKPGHDCSACPQPPKGQVVIHDYLKHNRSREEADEQRRKKSEAGRKGAASRWHGTSDGTRHSSSHGASDGDSMAESESESEKTRLTLVSQSPSASREVSEDGLTKIKALTRGDDAHARRVAADVLSKAGGDVRNVDRYVLAAIRAEPHLYRATRGNPRNADEWCGEPGHEAEWADACRQCAVAKRIGEGA